VEGFYIRRNAPGSDKDRNGRPGSRAEHVMQRDLTRPKIQKAFFNLFKRGWKAETKTFFHYVGNRPRARN
jgi:hypothetical protein